jgi:hypothetical protein
MPYYVGEGDPGWDEYCAWDETGKPGDPPASLMRYIEPWEAKTATVSFPETPGPEPEIPPRPRYPFQVARKPGLFAPLFGRKAAPAAGTPQLSPEQYWENHVERLEAACAHALWKVSATAAGCRALGVKRIYASYDGGGGESFINFDAAEMNDGRMAGRPALQKEGGSIDFDQLAEDAVFAIMGNFDEGQFTLRGAAVIDFEACTITDEKDERVVFRDEPVPGR